MNKNDNTIHSVMAMQLAIEAYNKLYKNMRAINGHISLDIFIMDVVTRGLNDILTTNKPSFPVDEAVRLHNKLQNM